MRLCPYMRGFLSCKGLRAMLFWNAGMEKPVMPGAPAHAGSAFYPGMDFFHSLPEHHAALFVKIIVAVCIVLTVIFVNTHYRCSVDVSSSPQYGQYVSVLSTSLSHNGHVCFFAITVCMTPLPSTYIIVCSAILLYKDSEKNKRESFSEITRKQSKRTNQQIPYQYTKT